MNVYHRLRNLRNCSKFIKVRSAHTSAKQAETDLESLPKQEAKISLQPTGIRVASIENYSPITHVAVAIKAGSQYEDAHNIGLVHCLRSCATLSTKNPSGFTITRNLELKGSKLSVASTREHIYYVLECSRDEIDSGLEILGDVVFNPAFKAWEINDLIPKLHLDLAMYENNSEAVLMENLHKVAFRGGLENSLYCPEFMVGKHSPEMLHNFVKTYFTASRAAVVGLGVGHDHLQKGVDQYFNVQSSAATQPSGTSSKFFGGEIRVESNIPFVHAAIVAEGSGHANVKDALSLGVLQCILGTGSSSDLSSGKFSKLGEAAAKCTNNPFAVSTLNINYADTGLFGVYVAGHANDMNQLVKAIVSQMRNATKSISDTSVEIAKHKLKAKLHIERETSKSMLSAVAVEVAERGEVADLKHLDRTIDELKLSDISAVASKVMKTKPAMASIGRLYCTPHLDELI